MQQTEAQPQRIDNSQIGNHTAGGVLLLDIVILAFATYGVYHAGTSQYYHHYDASVDNWLTAGFLAALSGLVAFTERWQAVLLVKSYRLAWSPLIKLVLILVLALTVAQVIMFGAASQGSTEEVKTTNIATHSQNIITLDNREKEAEATRQATLAIAKIKKAEGKLNEAALLEAAAQKAYARTITRISKDRSTLTSHTPIKQTTIFDQYLPAGFKAALFSVFCAIVIVLLEAYKQLFVHSYSVIPEVRLINKLKQDWITKKENFTSEDYKVSSLKGLGSLGFFGKAKPDTLSPVKADHSKTTDTQDQNPYLLAALGDEPRSVLCDQCNAEMKVYPDELAEATKHKGNLLCGHCHKKTNVITPKNKPASPVSSAQPEPEEKQQPSPVEPANVSDVPEWIKHSDTVIDTNYKGVPVYLRQNNYDSPLQSDSYLVAILTPSKGHTLFLEQYESRTEFTRLLRNPAHDTSNTKANFGKAIKEYLNLAGAGVTTDSQGLTEYIQEHSEAGKPRKTTEITENTPEIPQGNPTGKSQPKAINTTKDAATVTKKDTSQYEQHFAEVAKIKDQEAKLEALGSVIDKLAADPEHHGASFSSSAIRKQIGGRYDKVKAVFQQKKTEGKLAQAADRAPYTIVYSKGVM